MHYARYDMNNLYNLIFYDHVGYILFQKHTNMLCKNVLDRKHFVIFQYLKLTFTMQSAATFEQSFYTYTSF